MLNSPKTLSSKSGTKTVLFVYGFSDTGEITENAQCNYEGFSRFIRLERRTNVTYRYVFV